MKDDFKKNWDETKSNFAAWWRGDKLKRPLIYFYTKDTTVSRVKYKIPDSPEKMWTEYPVHLEYEEKVFSETEYTGETYPNTCARLGPGTFGTFLGSVPRFHYNTVWYDPCFDDISDVELKLDETGGWYKWSLDNTGYAREKANGRYVVSFSDFVENLDTLAQLFGTEKTLYYLLDAPMEVHRLQKDMQKLWFEAFDKHYQMIRDGEGWSSYGFFNLWAPGRVAKLQCDISACLSPEMFDEFVFPYLSAQCDWLDHSIYHLDGPDAICHLDSLLSIEALDCINWVAGAGKPDEADEVWFPMYKRILDAGKTLHIYLQAEKVPALVRKFSSSRMYIQAITENGNEAKEVLRECRIG